MSKVLDHNNFDAEVLQKKGLVLVDFWAEWCGPCRILGPIIEELAKDVAGKVEIGKMDVDQNGELAMTYGVMSIPTVILFKDGQPVEQVIGVRRKEDYLTMIGRYE